jgi:Cof subfamily protein (haloacid dehalogenase superfamily)
VIRLVAIDVDGTLLDSRGAVPEANLAALHAAAGRGVHVVVATGRSYPFALMAVAPLADPLTLVVYNGAVARVRGGATIATKPLAATTARRLLEHTRPWRDAALVQFDRTGPGQTVFDRLSWDHPNRRGYYAKIREHVAQVPDLEDALEGGDLVQVAFNGPYDTMCTLLEALASSPDARTVSVSATHYPARDFSLIDVNAEGATKGGMLAAVAAHFGVARHEVLAVGDNHNDVDMLQWAGTGVVMGNAEAEVLGLGLPVTGTHDEAGLAQAIRRYVLG